MKKLLLFLLLLTQIAIGQTATGTTKAGKYQMNIPDLGAKPDSVVVWNGTTKLLKYVPASTIIPVTNLNYTASTTTGIVSSSTGTNATIPVANTTNSGLFLPEEKIKLTFVETGAEVNVNADWNAKSGDAEILNKPVIDGAETKITAGTNATVSGLGTVADPYVISSTGGGSVSDGTLRTLGGGTFTSTPQQVSDNLNVKSPLYISNAGVSAAGNIASSTGNTVFGINAGASVMGSTQNAYFGYNSGNVSTAQANAGFGARTLQVLTTGTGNTALGSQALMGLTTGASNVVVGNGALELSTGNYNVIVGSNSGRVMTTGDYNTILGPNSTALDSGSNYNVVIGYIPSNQRAVLQNNIIIADGQGNKRFTVDNTGTARLPAQTIALTTAGGAQGIITKGYADIAYGAVNNTTTTALSSATLTSTYPNALIGFRVHALSVSGGAVVYEKAATGWIQIPVTVRP